MTEIGTTTATSSGTSTAPSAWPQPRRAFGYWLGTLRVLTVLHAVILIGQPLSIGQYLGGLYTWLGVHTPLGVLVVTAGVLLPIWSLSCPARRRRPPRVGPVAPVGTEDH